MTVHSHELFGNDDVSRARTGRSSAKPCTTARTTTCQRDMRKTLPQARLAAHRTWKLDLGADFKSELNTEGTERHRGHGECEGGRRAQIQGERHNRKAQAKSRTYR